MAQREARVLELLVQFRGRRHLCLGERHESGHQRIGNPGCDVVGAKLEQVPSMLPGAAHAPDAPLHTRVLAQSSSTQHPSPVMHGGQIEPQSMPVSVPPSNSSKQFASDGLAVGDAVGLLLGRALGIGVGNAEGDSVGLAVGNREGDDVGESEGTALGAGVGAGHPFQSFCTPEPEQKEGLVRDRRFCHSFEFDSVQGPQPPQVSQHSLPWHEHDSWTNDDMPLQSFHDGRCRLRWPFPHVVELPPCEHPVHDPHDFQQSWSHAQPAMSLCRCTSWSRQPFVLCRSRYVLPFPQ